MRTIFILSLLVMNVSLAQANHIQQNDSVFSIVDEMPEFKGGIKALNKFIVENLQHPEAVGQLGIKAKVYVKFVVNVNGIVEQAEVVRTSYLKPKGKPITDEAVEAILPKLEEEAMRFIQNLPPWNPGKKQGKKVRVSTTIPLVFRPSV